MNSIWKFAVALATLVLSAGTRAADGDLDLSFDTDGINATSFGASDIVYGGLLQSDGKLVVIGGGRPVTNQEMSAARFNTNGSLDTGFATGGKFSLDITPATTTDRGTCGGQQSDGKIIIGGYTRSGPGDDDFAIIRLTTAGVLDPTFGIGGIAKVNFNGGTDRANALRVLPDNRIVIAGNAFDFNGSPDQDLAVAMLTANGALDTSFDGDGKQTIDVGNQTDDAQAVAVQIDGSIVVAGAASSGGPFQPLIARLTATGALDTSFGGGDAIYSEILGTSIGDNLEAVEVQADGKIVASGRSAQGGEFKALIMRLTATGSLDTSFNSTGFNAFDLGSGSDSVDALELQADGKYALGGYWVNPAGGLVETVLARVGATGSLDGGFGTGGIKKFSLTAGNDRIIDMFLDGSNRLVAAVEAGTVGAEDFHAARFLNTVAVVTPSVSIAVSPTSVLEDGPGNLVYTVTSSAAVASATTVNIATTGTATSGADYTGGVVTVVIPATASTASITIDPTGDATIEPNETVILTVASGVGYTVGSPANATGTILNDDLPNLTINDVSVSEGNSGNTNFTFTVSLSAPAGTGGVTFDIATANGTATAGSDYVAQSLSAQTIPAASSSYTFTVLVNGDTLNEANETFFVNVTSATGANITDGQGLGTITNDDPLPSLSINDVSGTEGNSGTTNAVFTVTLNAASGQTVQTNYATADGTATQPADYTSTSGTLTFTPGQTTRTITVPVVGDLATESNETYFVNLSGATNATISDNQGNGTIVDDDLPTPPTITDIANQTVNEDVATSALAFTVDDVQTPAGSLVVTGSSSNSTLVPNANIAFGGSGAARTVTVSPAANVSGSSTITVTVTDGGGLTATDTFLLTVDPINDLPSFTAGPNQSLSLVNTDPQTVPNWATAIADGDPDFVQSLSFTVSNTNNGLFSTQPSVASDGTLSYTPSGALGAATVQVSLTDDATAGGAALTTAVQSFTILITSAAPSLTYEPPQLPNSLANSEQLRTVFFFNGASGAAQTRNGLVQITPSGGSSSAANTTTVNSCAIVGPEAGSFGDVSGVNLSFVGNTSPAQTVPLTCTSGSTNRSAVLNCTETRGASLPTLTRSWPVSCPTCNLQFSSTLDAAAPTLPPGTVGVDAITGTQTGRMNRFAVVSTCAAPKTSPGTFTTTGARRFDRYRITPVRSGCVNVQLVAGAGTGVSLFHYAVSSFDPANPTANYIADPGSSFPIQGSFQLTATAGTPFDVVVHEVNSGGGDLPYTLNLDACTVEPNAAPTISDVANQTVNEDTATSALPFTVGDLETLAAALTVSGSSSNTALVPNGNIVFGGTGANRTVAVTPAANVSGSSTITLTVTDDGGGTATDTFVLTVNPINDLPSFLAGANQSLPPGTSTPQSVANWATSINDGDPDFAQTLSFNVSNNNNALFTAQPTVAANGTLSFTPTGLSGSSLVSVSLTDDNTAGGAALTTAIQTFTITVLAGSTAISVDDVTVTEGNAGTANAVFTVSRGNRFTSFTVPYSVVAGSAQAGTDYVATSGTLSFAEGAAQPLSQTISVPVVGDLVVEGTESATLTLGAISNVTGTTTIGDGSGLLTINDNDSATVSFTPSSASQSEATTPMAFTVTLSNPVASGVTVTVNSTIGTADTADFTAISGGTVSFAANSTTAQTVNVTINNDALDEDDETYTLALSGLTATGNVTLGAGAATATGTIVDDDPTPTLSVTSPSLAEGDVGTSVMNFVVNLSTVSGRDVTFTRATADDTAVSTGPAVDFVAIPAGTLTIPAGQLSLTIPVTINGDTPYEGDETFTVQISAVSNATPASLTGTGTIVDDDQQPTTTTITGDTPDPTVVGQAYTVSASVVAQTTSPLGTVTISDGSASCNATLTVGSAPNSAMSCLLTSTSAGAKTLTASYTPASSAFAASSDTDTHQVNAAATTISVSGPARSRINQATSFSFVLGVTTPGAGTPTGVVTLSSGPATCTATLPATSCSLTFTTLGERTVTASYASDGNFGSSTSSGAGNAQTLVYAESDLSISKTDGIGYYEPGDLLVYSVIVRNLGPDDAANIRVVDTIPAGLTDVVWSCDASGGGVCPAAGGAGNFDVILANVRVGALLNFTFFGNVAGSPLVIANTASIVLPVDTTIDDPVLGNNSATDTNQIDFTFRNGFEDPQVSAPAGSARVAGIALARSLGNEAQMVLSLDDAQGEALRVYARMHDNSLQYALARRASNGVLRLEAWRSLPGEPTLSWSARAVATGWVLESAQLR